MVNRHLMVCNPPSRQNRNRQLTCQGGMFLGIFLLLIDEVEREGWGWMI
jgi:hypothetical protein